MQIGTNMNNYINDQVYNIRRNGRVVRATYNNGRFSYTHRRTNITINADAVEVLPDNYVEPFRVEPPPQTPLRQDGEYYWVRHNGQWIVALWSNGSFHSVGVVTFDYLHNVFFPDGSFRHIARPADPVEQDGHENRLTITTGGGLRWNGDVRDFVEPPTLQDPVPVPRDVWTYPATPIPATIQIGGEAVQADGVPLVADQENPRGVLTDEEFEELVRDIQPMQDWVIGNTLNAQPTEEQPLPTPEITVDYVPELIMTDGPQPPTSTTEECDWI